MSDRAARIETLRRANHERHHSKRKAVEEAIADMQRRGLQINVNAVAVRARVSRNFIYQTDDLRQAVKAAAADNPGRMPQGRTTATEASLRSRLATTTDALSESKERVRELELRIEALTAEVVRLQSSDA